MQIPWRLLLVGLFLTRKGSGGKSGSGQGVEPYTVDLDRPWGPGWGKERPKGLPAGSRRVGVANSAREDILSLAAAQGLGSDFGRVMADLARTESGAMYGRPARPPYAVSAGYGAFQWNQGAWDWARFPGNVWESTPDQELRLPIGHYAKLWRSVTKAGGNARDAARLVRVWHRSPRAAKNYRRIAAETSWAQAWDQLRASAEGYDAKSIERTDRDIERLGYV